LQPAVSTHDLTKVFDLTTGWSFLRRRHGKKSPKTVTAVDHVNLDIHGGEFFGLVGPNGAGKTTLIKVLATLITPTEGSADVCGYDLLEQSREVRKSVGLVSISERSFYFRLTAYQNLYFFGSLYNIPRRILGERIETVLSTVGLGEWGDVTYMKFSAGMQRKLAIARGLLADPPLLLMDEPTIGLDPGSAKRTRDLLKSMLQSAMNKTILFTTHQMHEADRLCDRVAIIHEGRLIACDTPRNLKRTLSEQDFIEIKGRTGGRVEGGKPLVGPQVLDAISRVKGVSQVNPLEITQLGSGVDCLLIRVGCDDGAQALQPIIEILMSSRFTVEDASIVEPTLEDVFIHLTEGAKEEGTKDIDKATHVWTRYGNL